MAQKRDPVPTSLTLDYPPELANIPNKRVLRCQCTVGTGAAKDTVMTKVSYEDEVMIVTLFLTRTGIYELNWLQGGKPLLAAPMELEINPQEFIPQPMPADEVRIGTDGVEITLQPIYDTAGVRVWFGPNDLEIVTDGGPKDDPLYSTAAEVKKESDGLLHIKIALPCPGHYVTQVFVFGREVLDPPLRVEVWDEHYQPQKKVDIPAMFVGESTVVNISQFSDPTGTPISTYLASQITAIFRNQDHEVPSTTIVLGPGLLGVAWVPPVDGYYNAYIYDARTSALLVDPFDVYVGIRGLKQQLPHNGVPIKFSMDGASIQLSPITNHSGQVLDIMADDLVVDVVGEDDNNSFMGSYEFNEEGPKIFLLPPAPGNYICNLFLYGKPVFSYPLFCTVEY